MVCVYYLIAAALFSPFLHFSEVNYISTKNVTIGRHLRLKNVCRSDMKELLDTSTVDYSKHALELDTSFVYHYKIQQN